MLWQTILDENIPYELIVDDQVLNNDMTDAKKFINRYTCNTEY